MGLFSIFSKPDFMHPVLGLLRRRHGCWVGQSTFADGRPVEIRLHGGRDGPSPLDVERLTEALRNFENVKLLVEPKIFEEYLAYRDADTSGKIMGTDEPFPILNDQGLVWEHIWQPVLRVGPYSKPEEVEFCFNVTWDIEHTLGALFSGNKLIELCGSIRLPR